MHSDRLINIQWKTMIQTSAWIRAIVRVGKAVISLKMESGICCTNWDPPKFVTFDVFTESAYLQIPKQG